MIRLFYYVFCKLLMLERILVEEHQRALLFNKGQFINVLHPGLHHFLNFTGQISYEIFDLNTLEFDSKYADILMKHHPEMIEQYLFSVDVSDEHLAIIAVDGKMYTVLSPGTRQLFWKELREISVEFVNITEQYEIPQQKIRPLARIGNENVLVQVVPESFAGVLFVDGKFVKTVPAGMYAYWNANRNVRFEIIDIRLQQVDVSGQEMLTKDRVSLRVTLTCYYIITDPVKVKTSVSNYVDHLYKELQFGIREAVGAKPLDELLADKDALNTVVLDHVKAGLREIGIEVRSIGVKDVILPGDMRDIMNKVIEAQKLAEANQIKRREETAATRSLLNTAKLMDSNPTLMRLKELETLEKVTENIGSVHVYGGLDGLLREFVTFKKEQSATDRKESRKTAKGQNRGK